MIYLSSHTFSKLCPLGMENFPQNLYSCLCPSPINLSYCLLHLLHQGALVEVSEMVHDKVGIGLWSIQGSTVCLMLAGVGELKQQLQWHMMLWLSSFLRLGYRFSNGCTTFGAGVGIGGAGVCIGFGMGGVTLGFLLVPALPCLILGLGMGGIVFVGGL